MAARLTNYKIRKTTPSNVPAMAKSAQDKEMAYRKYLVDLLHRKHPLKNDSHIPEGRDPTDPYEFRFEIMTMMRVPPFRWPKPDGPPGSQPKTAVASATDSHQLPAKYGQSPSQSLLPLQGSTGLQQPFNPPRLSIKHPSGIQRLYPAQDPSGLQHRIGPQRLGINRAPNFHPAFDAQHPSNLQHRFNPPKLFIPPQPPLKLNQPFNPPPPTRLERPSGDLLQWSPQQPINHQPLLEPPTNPSSLQHPLDPDLPSEFRPSRRLRLKLPPQPQHPSESHQQHSQEDQPPTRKRRYD